MDYSDSFPRLLAPLVVCHILHCHRERGGSRGQLAHTRSRGAKRKDRTHRRAMHNWHRAQAAVSRKLTSEMLGTQRKCG